jgi:plasmid stability protein
MQKPKQKPLSIPVTIRFSTEAYEELLRISAAQHGGSIADAVRQLIDQALVHRAEQMTASQFELVGKRLESLEKTLSRWLALGSKIDLLTLFYSREHMLLGASNQQRIDLEEAAHAFTDTYLPENKERLLSQKQPNKKGAA